FNLPLTFYTGSMQWVDMDGDNDLDLFTFNGTAPQYYENIGSVSSANYATPVNNPFSFSINPYHGRLVDIDNDGDYDLIGAFNQFFIAINTGTAQIPAFAAAVYADFS